MLTWPFVSAPRKPGNWMRWPRSHACAFLVLATLCAPPLDAVEPPPLTLERLLATPSLTGTVPSAPAWSPDSRLFAFTWSREGLAQRSLWIASQDGGDARRLGSDAAATSVRDFAWLPGGNRIISLRGDGLWSTAVDGDGRDTLLATIGDGASDLTISPDGTRAAWLQAGDLWLYDFGSRTAAAATNVGLPGLSTLAAGRYSRPEREIGPGIWGGPTYAWAPDGATIAVHYVDRRHLRAVPFPDYLAPETAPNAVRRGYPGDANELRTVGLLRVADGELTLLDLADPTRNQVVDFSWSPGGVLLLDLASDTVVDRWLYSVEPGSTELNEIWRSNRPTRVYTAMASAWHPDGERIVFLGDLHDRYGLYSLDPRAVNPEPTLMTAPDADVLGAPSVAAASGEIFYAANGTSPYERHVYQLRADGGASRRITDMPGQNTGFPSPDGRHMLVMHSDDTNPPDLYVYPAAGGAAQRVTRSPPPEFYARQWAQARYVTFPSRTEDRTLHARILEPAALEPGRQYPVLFGPMYSNTVRNRWAGVYSDVQQLLVQKGYLVVQVDMRGSTGYGRDFREAFLLDFAGGDIEDIASAVDYLRTLPHVDPDRLGIWGSSYGGTLAVYSLLTKPGLFRAGVAAAAAVDPRFFGTDDVAIVRRPDSHPEIFEHTARRYAANLEDPLLIMHGMQDQVVPFKTAAALVDALIKAGKDFDVAIAPGATHAWSREPDHARYLFATMLAFFDRHLAAPVDAATETAATE